MTAAMSIGVIVGDVRSQDVAAIIVAADASSEVSPGEAVAVRADDSIKADWVIHAGVPVGPCPDHGELLVAAYYSAWDRAEEVAARSVALASIASNSAGYPLIDAIDVAVGEARGRAWSVEEVRFVAADSTELDMWTDAVVNAGMAASLHDGESFADLIALAGNAPSGWVEQDLRSERDRGVLGLHDLVRAWNTARLWRDSADELAEYSAARYTAMSRAFRIDLEATSAPDADRLDSFPDRMLERAMECLKALDADPFAGWYIIPSEWTRSMRPHGQQLTQAFAAAQDAVVALAVDLVVRRFGVAPDATIDPEELRAFGFDPGTIPPNLDEFC